MELPISSHGLIGNLNFKTIPIKFGNKEGIMLSDAVCSNELGERNDDENKDESILNPIRKKHIVFENKEVMKQNKRRSYPIPVPTSALTDCLNTHLNLPIYHRKRTNDPPRQLTPQITKRSDNKYHKDSIKSHEETKSTLTQKSINIELNLNNIHIQNYNEGSIKSRSNKEDISSKKEQTDTCILSTEENTVSKYLYTEHNSSDINDPHCNCNGDENDLFNEHLKNLIHIQEQYEKLNVAEKRKSDKILIRKTDILKNNLKKFHLKIQKHPKLNLNKKQKINMNQIQHYNNRSNTIFKKYCTNNSLNANKAKEWEKKPLPINIFNIISNQNHHLDELNNKLNNKDNQGCESNYDSNKIDQLAKDYDSHDDCNSHLLKKSNDDDVENVMRKKNTPRESAPYDETPIRKMKAREEPIRRYSSSIEEQQSRLLIHSRNVINKMKYPIHSVTVANEERGNNKLYENDAIGLFYNYSNFNLENDINIDKNANGSESNDKDIMNPDKAFKYLSPDHNYKMKYFQFNSTPYADPIQQRYSYIKADTEYNLSNRLNQRYSLSSYNNTGTNNTNNTPEEYTHMYSNTLTHNNKQTNNYKYNHFYYNNFNQGLSFSSREKEINKQKKELYAKAFRKVDFSKIYKSKGTYLQKLNTFEENPKRQYGKK